MSVSPILKYRTLAIAKSLAPVDTGNLRHNAISMKRNKAVSWSINYSTRDATYIIPLEEGWHSASTGEYHTTHKRFIETTSKVLAVYLKGYFEGKPQSRWYGRQLQNALSSAKDNPGRQLRNIESKIRFKSEVLNK